MSEPGLPWLSHYPENIDWHATPCAGPVQDMLAAAVTKYGDRPAFDFFGRTWRWREIGAFAARIAAGLQSHGVRKGVKVGLFLPNTPYFLAAYYGILQAGGTVVNFNPLYAQRELQHQAIDSEIEIMITLDLKALHDKVAALDSPALRTVVVCPFALLLPFPKNLLFPLARRRDIAAVRWGKRFIPLSDLTAHGDRPAPVAIDPHEDLAVLQYTGGTTGVPKGAMLTHANISANTDQARMWFTGVQPGGERMLGVLPFFHVFAMTAVMNLSVLNGFEIVALPRFDLEETVRTIRRKAITCFPAVPAIFNAINHYTHRERLDLSSLRVCISGGAPMPAEVQAAFGALGGPPALEGYGLTEASPVVSMNPLQGGARAGTIGLPFPATTVSIRDLEDGRVLGVGERGELCVKGPQVMKGYYKKPDETALVFTEDGYLRTGDVAVMDPDGYLTIVDRIKDMIIVNGYKVYPRLVEEVVYTFPGVEECIVGGIADPHKGEVVKCWIKPKEDTAIAADAVREFLKGKLSSMEMPRQIEIRRQPLPKTAVGKLSRKDIIAEEANMR